MSAPSFSLAGNARGPGNRGTPMLYFKSTQNNPSVRTVTMISKYPFIYQFYDSQGHFLKSAYLPGPVAQSPYSVTADFTGFVNFTLPNWVTVIIQDGGSTAVLNTQRIQLLGGDVFNVTVTYNDTANSGKQMMSIDGAHIPVRLEELDKIFLESSDAHFNSNNQ